MTTGNPITQTTEEKPVVEHSPEAGLDPTGEEALRLLDQANAGVVASEEKKDILAGKKKEPEAEEDRRAKIAKNHRERRKAEMRGEATDINDPALANGAHATGTEAPAGETQQTADSQAGQQTQEQAATEPQKREVELTIDGKTVKQMLTDEQILTAARATLQKDGMADYRLQNATRLQREAEQRLAAMDGSRTAPPTNANGEAHADDTRTVPINDSKAAPTAKAADALSREKMTDIVQKWQVGSTEEAVSALEELVKAVAPQQPVDVEQQVQHAIRRDRDISASTDAMTNFAKTHGAAFSAENDPDGVASYAFETVVTKEMIKDLQAAGYTNEVLDHYGLRKDKDALKVAHTALRQNGNAGIRSVGAILDAASKDEAFLRYAKTGKIQPKVEVNRQDRKDGLPQQPAQRGAPPAPVRPNAEETRAAGMSSAVTKMRAARGQLGATS